MYFIIEPTDGQHIKCKDCLLRARRMLVHVHVQRVNAFLAFYCRYVRCSNSCTELSCPLVMQTVSVPKSSWKCICCLLCQYWSLNLKETYILFLNYLPRFSHPCMPSKTTQHEQSYVFIQPYVNGSNWLLIGVIFHIYGNDFARRQQQLTNGCFQTTFPIR